MAMVAGFALARGLLLLALPIAAVPVWTAWRGRRRGRRTAAFSVALQAMAIALAVVALAGPSARLAGRRARAILLLRDVSDSTRAQWAAPLDWPDDPKPIAHQKAADDPALGTSTPHELVRHSPARREQQENAKERDEKSKGGHQR